MKLRWENAYKAIGQPAVAELWSTRTQGRSVLIGGAGFDPRAPVAYECLAAACPRPIDVVEIHMDSLATDPATAKLALAGRARIEAAAAATGASVTDHQETEPVSFTGIQIARDFFAAKHIDGYDEVILDISALPRSVFFALVRGLLTMHDEGEWAGQLHVVACDNPQIDRRVIGEGIEPAAALPGFSDLNPPASQPTKIWVPVLGEGETLRVDALHQEISPQEVCPVLPFPSKEPRRADDIIREYRELMFERIAVEPRNIIYASESNPFDLYRSLSALNEDYEQSLSPLGETRMILSAHSSKLLSVGVLLTAYEHGLEVRHVSPTVYTAQDPDTLGQLAGGDLVVDLWLTGEPYA